MASLTNTAWRRCTMHQGEFRTISSLVEGGNTASHIVEIYGNSDEGFAVYLSSKAVPNAVICVSPIFHKDFGDTLRDCREACARVYGVTPRFVRGSCLL